MMPFRFRHFLQEPYRPFFAIGSLYAVLAVGVWFTWLHALDHAIVLADFLDPPRSLHALVMLYGVLSFYVFGFLLTAFPRFVDQPHPSRRLVLLWVSGLTLSQLLLVPGSMVHLAWLWPAGLLQVLVFSSIWIFLLRLYVRSGNIKNNRQPAFLLAALLAGTLGLIFIYLHFAARQGLQFYAWGIELGTYPYLLLLVVAITYRVVPFFTGRVVSNYTPQRGRFTLGIVLGILGLRILSTLFDDPTSYLLSWSLNLVLLAVLAGEWWRWLPKNIKTAPILMVLYLGLSWILIFLGFSGYELAVHFFNPETPPFALFATPALHALYIGAFGTLLLGISTRVVRGHGGLPIQADAWMLAALVCIQLAALIRVLIPLLAVRWMGLIGQNYWAGLFWCVAFGIWCYRYLPILGHPKIQEP